MVKQTIIAHDQIICYIYYNRYQQKAKSSGDYEGIIMVADYHEATEVQSVKTQTSGSLFNDPEKFNDLHTKSGRKQPARAASAGDFCINCGAVSSSTSRYCRSCGNGAT